MSFKRTCWPCRHYNIFGCRIKQNGFPLIGADCLHFICDEAGTDEAEAIAERLIDCQGMTSESSGEK